MASIAHRPIHETDDRLRPHAGESVVYPLAAAAAIANFGFRRQGPPGVEAIVAFELRLASLHGNQPHRQVSTRNGTKMDQSCWQIFQ